MSKSFDSNVEYWQMNIFENMAIHNQVVYTCSAMKVLRESYVYTRRNYAHHHRDTGMKKIIIMTNFDATSEQVSNVVNLFLRGGFEKHDTSDFD